MARRRELLLLAEGRYIYTVPDVSPNTITPLRGPQEVDGETKKTKTKRRKSESVRELDTNIPLYVCFSRMVVYGCSVNQNIGSARLVLLKIKNFEWLVATKDYPSVNRVSVTSKSICDDSMEGCSWEL